LPTYYSKINGESKVALAKGFLKIIN
jgi:hypothetical protein